jgi:hypothetical protein
MTTTRLVIIVIALIAAALGAGAYFDFNPAIPIFVILAYGIYKVGSIGGPVFPDDTHVSFGNTYGVYLEGQDFVPPDIDSHSGPNFRDGVDPKDLNKAS